jgi:3'(2'), 5'-bisphosphate nucleotidase
MDSQCKYGCIARGDAEIFMRLPVNDQYVEKIWDHAPGYLLVKEAGGVVTDINGKDIDFSRGRTLNMNRGIIATSKSLHPFVIEAISCVKSNKL